MTNPLNFSKSKYCGLWQCPKIAWLRKYKPEAWTPDDALAERMRVGDEIGDLAMGLFGPYVEVSARDGDRLDLAEMVRRTGGRFFWDRGTVLLSYRAIRSMMDLLVTGMIHRTE